MTPRHASTCLGTRARSRPGVAIPPKTPPRTGRSIQVQARPDIESTTALSPISPWPPSPPSPPPDDLATDRGPSSAESRNPRHGPSHVVRGQRHAHGDDLPNAVDVYSSIAVLGTYALFGLYLLWAFSPADKWWIAWLPDRQWAIIVPCWLMMVVLLTYWSYAALVIYRTPAFDSPDCITDPFANIPELPAMNTMPDRTPRHQVTAEGTRERLEPYYWRFAGEKGTSEAVDLPIDLVGRVLYPPRPAHQSA
ncbi:phosphatidylinositol glycan, class P [Kwoniella heveanensis CBS 569]|nr:phosphatidylinositol glycan, class P [Kwoniella heveanensis CBS 569]